VTAVPRVFFRECTAPNEPPLFIYPLRQTSFCVCGGGGACARGDRATVAQGSRHYVPSCSHFTCRYTNLQFAHCTLQWLTPLISILGGPAFDCGRGRLLSSLRLFMALLRYLGFSWVAVPCGRLGRYTHFAASVLIPNDFRISRQRL
jgi:hypothetical protein